MTLPEKRSGPPINAESRPRESSPRTSASVTDLLVPVVAYAPGGRRSRWLAILEICPRCQQPHQFYGSRAAPPRIRTCCGNTYVLHPVYGGNSEPPEDAL
ncbi:hypothetical protein [Actinomadura opuntiae]|uniref:hypothetical protein n=1 Tax=Actinomadura sp. OS1-43 TaxID=604315 RepID=UPI00255AEBD5|nr:hypothetical protein [Actinomadura sp. OS1-43]MDL4814980.1 hypothetical protein [Actinomadura sp. OS1-43]